MSEKVLIIGWDGATFDVIRPLVAAGRMPTMARLLEEGAHAPLNSTTPAVTPVAWSSFMTGVSPGAHGVFDAFRFDPQAQSLTMAHAGMRRAPTIFKILDDRGRPSGALNIPLTWPPDALRHGFVLTGMFTPGEVADMVHPPELKTELESALGSLSLEPDMHSQPEVYLQRLLDNIQRQEEITAHLMQAKPWDLLASVFIDSDRVQHIFWKYTDPQHPEHATLGDAIARVYQALDASLGRLLAAAPEGVRLCMVSDHGAGPLHTTVFLNQWLMDQGHLTLKHDLFAMLRNQKGPAGSTPFRQLLKKLLPNSVVGKIQESKAKARQARRNRFLECIDWENTVAFSEGVSGGVYLNTAHMDAAARGAIIQKIIAGLLEITDPKTNTKVITAVHRREDLYNGVSASHAPDLFVECAPGYQIIVPNEVLFFKEEYDGGLFLSHKWSGRHEQFGIFVLHGPGVRQGPLPKADMPDVAPTLLHLLGEAIPAHMEGRALTEALEGEHTAATTDSAADAGHDRELTPEEEAAMAQQLQDLGYL